MKSDNLHNWQFGLSSTHQLCLRERCGKIVWRIKDKCDRVIFTEHGNLFGCDINNNIVWSIFACYYINPNATKIEMILTDNGEINLQDNYGIIWSNGKFLRTKKK
jgi:hypothetical protein